MNYLNLGIIKNKLLWISKRLKINICMYSFILIYGLIIYFIFIFYFNVLWVGWLKRNFILVFFVVVLGSINLFKCVLLSYFLVKGGLGKDIRNNII